MTAEQLRAIAAAAMASPSVHNVQPARWRIEDDTLVLLEDTSRRLTVGDPRGNDAAISLGAAAEGAAIAASGAGLAARVERLSGEETAGLRPAARLTFAAGAAPDPLLAVLEARASWRGSFLPPTAQDRAAADALAGADRVIITAPAQIAEAAALYDRASFGIMRRHDFRAELRHWMRLNPRHPDWARDGLNAAAMQLSGIEAAGAGAVLGPLFRPLAALGLAPALLAEAKGFAHAAAVVLFHRAADEDPFESGRAFHRLWLEVEAGGLGGNVLAALADDPAAAMALRAAHGIGPERRLVSALRIGRRDGAPFPRARLPLSEVLLD
jgi:nitroreductase